MSSPSSGIKFLVERFLSIRGAWQARYHDGCIYYVSDVTGVPLLWRACPGGAGFISDLVLPWRRRIGDYRIGPGGGLVFASDFDGDERWALYHYDGEDVRLIAGEDGSMNLLGAWSDNGSLLAFTSNKRNGVDFDYYIYDGRGSRMAAMGEGISTVETWLDGMLVAVRRNSNLDSDIVLVDPGSGRIRVLTSHEGEELNVNPVVVGGRIAFISDSHSEYRGVWLLDPESMERRPVFTPEGDVERIEYSGGSLYVSVNINGASWIYRLELDGWEARPTAVYSAKWVVTLLSRAPEGVLASASSPREGLEAYYIRPPRVERVTWSPKLGLEDLFREPTDFYYESFDGLRIHGLLYEPRSGRRPRPAVVWLHGGPESQSRPTFNPIQQALQHLGVAVVAPNFRGSTGYGRTFTHLDDVEKRMDAVRDVAEAVEHLVSQGVIREKPCVMGGSYGGYLTLMSLAIYPDLWSCGVEIVGIVNLVTFIRNTSPYRRRYRIAEYGDPEKHGEIMMKLSPITYVDRIKAPLLVIHGARDPRVPVSEAEQLVEALKARGVEVRYIRLEDEGHGIVKIDNRVRVYTEAVQFILENLGVAYGF